MPMALQSNPWLGNTRDPNQQQKVQHIIFVTPETPQQASQPQQPQEEHRGLLKIPTSIKTAPYTHTERFTQTEARPAVYQRVCLEAQPGQPQQPQQQPQQQTQQQAGTCKPGEPTMFDPSMQQQQQQQQSSGPAQMYTTEKPKDEGKTNTVEFPFCYNVNMIPKGQGEEQKCYRFDAVQPFGGYNYALVNQMSLAAAASTATFKCDVCGLAFGHLTLLNHHKRIHTNNTNAPANANAPASTNAVVNTAQQTVNTTPTTVERAHACDICSATFAMPGELKAHKNQMHKAPPAPKCCNSCGVEIPCEHSKGKKGKYIKCENCLESANNQASFVSGNGTSEASSGESSEVPTVKPGHHPVKRRGMATVTKCQKCNGSGIIFVGGTRSTVEKPFHCNVCDGTFSRYSSLWSHKRLHSGEKPFKCEICGLAFAKAAYLKNHGRVHTGEKPYKCSVCGMQFSQSPHLKNHERIHSGERPYQCEVCDKMFARHSTLWNHRRIHTGEKPYRCNVCGSAFNQATHLKNHTKVHTGEKPHRCDICDVGFSDRFALKRHRGIHEKYGRTAPNTAPNSATNPANGAGSVGTVQQAVQQAVQQTVQQSQPAQQQQQQQAPVGQVMEEMYKCEVRNQVPDYTGQGGDAGGTA